MATKGQVAEQMKGVHAVEYKAIIRDHQVEPAIEHFNLRRKGHERQIFFFDTPDLKLFKAGVIGRARRISGGTDDSTIKFRPVEAASIPKKWKQMEGFKIEADANEDLVKDTGHSKVVKSASYSRPVKKGQIKRVAAGDKPISVLFTEDQLQFLVDLAKHPFDFSEVRVMGPMKAWRWEFKNEGLPWKLYAEVWERDDKDLICEVSIKVPVQQAAAAKGGFMAFLAEVGAEREEGQLAKTHWFLDYYSKQLD